MKAPVVCLSYPRPPPFHRLGDPSHLHRAAALHRSVSPPVVTGQSIGLTDSQVEILRIALAARLCHCQGPEGVQPGCFSKVPLVGAGGGLYGSSLWVTFGGTLRGGHGASTRKFLGGRGDYQRGMFP